MVAQLDEGPSVDVAGKILTVTTILAASGSDLLRRGRRRRKDSIPELSEASGAPWWRGIKRFPVVVLFGGEEQREGRKGERKRATAAAERKGLGQQ